MWEVISTDTNVLFVDVKSSVGLKPDLDLLHDSCDSSLKIQACLESKGSYLHFLF